MRRFSLIQRFSIVLFLTLLGVGILFGNLLTHFMKQDMLDRSNIILAGFIQEEIKQNLQLQLFSNAGNESIYAEQTRQIGALNLGPDVIRVKVWNGEGSVVWSSKPEEVGERHTDHHELIEVFNGKIYSGIASQEYMKEKYAYEIEHDVMELYVPIRSGETGEVVLVFELYRNIDQLLVSIARHNRLVWLATLAVASFLYLILFAMVWKASKRMDWQSSQIKTAKNEWEETFDTINDAITIHDSNFNIIRANRAAERILGLSINNILKQKCFLSYHGADTPPAICPSCETARSGKESASQMYEPNLDKHIEIKALPRFNRQKELIGVVHVVRDITEQKKAEERQEKLQAQLNQIQKMESVGTLAGGIAHDFNNMLSIIIGYCEIILNSLGDEKSQLREDVKTIKDSGEKAGALTRQLLAFSRNQVLNVKPLDLNSVVEGMIKMLSRVISENIKLDLHLDKSISKVAADESQLEQVLLNLTVNARDAMPEGGYLIIETQTVELDDEFVDQHAEAVAGTYVLLSVTDTGTGMPKDVRLKIFEPFFTTKEVGKGTGLGLSTVYGIVRQHGGQIYVYSEPGQGTTFKIYLPASEGRVVEEKMRVSELIPPGTETVLLVEDEKTIRQMIKSTMEKAGYHILEAANGEEAVEVSTSFDGNIHLLLTDVVMPKMNGGELAKALQKTRPEMEVIFMSGYTDDAISRHGVLEAGVHFIQKPITPSVLAKTVQKVLKKN